MGVLLVSDKFCVRRTKKATQSVPNTSTEAATKESTNSKSISGWGSHKQLQNAPTLLATRSTGYSALSLTRSTCRYSLPASSKLFRSVTEYTRRNPRPFLMYCSRIAENSSCPAVSRTGNSEDECVPVESYFRPLRDYRP